LIAYAKNVSVCSAMGKPSCSEMIVQVSFVEPRLVLTSPVYLCLMQKVLNFSSGDLKLEKFALAMGPALLIRRGLFDTAFHAIGDGRGF